MWHFLNFFLPITNIIHPKMKDDFQIMHFFRKFLIVGPCYNITLLVVVMITEAAKQCDDDDDDDDQFGKSRSDRFLVRLRNTDKP